MWGDGTLLWSQEWHVVRWHELEPQTVLSLLQKPVCAGSPVLKGRMTGAATVSVNGWNQSHCDDGGIYPWIKYGINYLDTHLHMYEHVDFLLYK